MEYKTPVEYIERQLGPDKLKWNLSYQWLDGFYQKDMIVGNVCPEGHLLPAKAANKIIEQDQELCLECRFEEGSLAISTNPFAGFACVVQWVGADGPSISVRLLDDFRDKSYRVFTNEDWFWLIADHGVL